METPFEKKNCSDCSYLREVITLWCTNKKAIKYRGTAIPGVNHCSHWSPDWQRIPKQFQTEENGFIKPLWKRKLKL